MLLKKKGTLNKNNKKKSKRDSTEGNADSKDDHIFKVPSLESFRLQKNKSSKLLSPPIPKIDEQKDKSNTEVIIDSEKHTAEDSSTNETERLKSTAVKKLVSVKLKSIATSGENQTTSNLLPSNIENDEKEDNKTSSKSLALIKDESNAQSAIYKKSSKDKICDGLPKNSLIGSELSDTEDTDDGPKKIKKLVKTRKTRSTEETSDDDLSPLRQSRSKVEQKYDTTKSTDDCNDSGITSSSDTVGQKRKTRSQSLTSESESESEEEKPSKKCSSKSKVFKQCENSQDNKEKTEKDRKIKKNNSKNSESENDSDEGIQKRRTRQQKNLIESDSKESGSDKENELSPTEIKEVTNALGLEENNDVKKLIPENETENIIEPIKDDIGLHKKVETSLTRRTRGSIKSKDEAIEKIKEETTGKIENEESILKNNELKTTKSKVATNENDNEDDLRNIGGKRKTRSSSVESTEERADTPTRLTRGKVKSEGTEPNVLEAGKRTLRKRSNSGGSNNSSVSPSRSSPDDHNKKCITPTPSNDVEDDEDDGEIVLNMPRQLRDKIILENKSPMSSPNEKQFDEKQAIKRTTRNSEQLEETVDNKTTNSSTTLGTSKAEKRKISEDIDSPVKNNAHKKIKLLGPKSQRKNIPIKDESDSDMEEETQKSKEPRVKKKMLGPKSKRKKSDILSDTEDEEEDSTENMKHNNDSGESNSNDSDKTNSKETENSNEEKKSQSEPVTPTTPTTPTLSFIQKKKHNKCDLKLVSLFKHELCKAKCGHCQELGKYTVHMVHFDMPQKIIQMECQSCNWTTVRRMVLTTRVVG